MNGWRARSTDMSTTAPMRNPSRIPFFTHALTRQPVGEAASGSAARTSPRLTAALNSRKSRKMLLRCIEPEARQTIAQFAVAACTLSSDARQVLVRMQLSRAIERFQHGANARFDFPLSAQRAANANRFEQAHLRHRRLHRDRDSTRRSLPPSADARGDGFRARPQNRRRARAA